MAEDKQLTVAEILAKAQKDNPEAGERRRRRRRSLEEGGVSVAELTGSLKKVDARPAEPKHSSVPIDGPEKPATAAKPAEPAASAPAEKSGSSKLQPAAAAKPAAAPAAKPAVAQTNVVKQSAPQTPAPAKAEASKADDKTVVMKAVKEEPKPEAAKPAQVKPEGSFERDFVREPGNESAPAEPVKEAEPVKITAPVEVEEPFEPSPALPAEEIVVEEDSINPIMLVLYIFGGVVLGILGFLLFQWIWANAHVAVAALIAAATVVAVVFGVRAMRTGRDGLTLTLAGIAAVVTTFGPALL